MRFPVTLALLLAAGSAAAEPRDETVPLTLSDGRVIQATLRFPAQARGRLPAIMLFGGFRRAAQVLDRVKLDRPVVWATFDYPFTPPRKFEFPESLGHAPEMRAAVQGSFDGVGKLYQVLKQHPRVDPRRITVVGASAGAPFATVGGADHAIPGVVLVQGFGDAEDVLTHLIARKYHDRYGGWIRGPARLFVKWVLWYCDVPELTDYAARMQAHQQVLMIAAADDQFVPKPASDALWQALERSGAQRERIELAGGHLGIGDDSALIAEILRRSLAWMEQRGLI